jgi:4'-phosphopantetheinyl transferase
VLVTFHQIHENAPSVTRESFEQSLHVWRFDFARATPIVRPATLIGEGLPGSAAPPTRLEPEEVHVWMRVTDAVTDSVVEQTVSVLSADERSRFEKFVFARDRRDYALAHALLRTALARYVGVGPEELQFRVAPRGKPFLVSDQKAAPVSFNISHTNGLVACAITGGAEVGIDVESVSPAPDYGVVPDIFSGGEIVEMRRLVSPLDQARRFYQLWTLKEAFVKATGDGLYSNVREIVFDFDHAGAVVLQTAPQADAGSWKFAMFAPTPRHCAAIALRGESDGVSFKG